MATSGSGPSVTLNEFRVLLRDREFVDYFNKFLSLPVFPQIAVYSMKREKFIFDPPISKQLYKLNHSGLIEWLWRKRLNLFLKSHLYGEYSLCRSLIYHSVTNESLSGLTPAARRAVQKTIKWFQKTTCGGVSSMRRFRRFLQSTADGYKLYQFWLDAERLYFHIKRRSSSCIEIFNQIRDKYFATSGEVQFPQHLLDAAWDNLPKTTEMKAKYGGAKRDAKSYDLTFIMCLQKLCLNRLKNYWLPRYLTATKFHKKFKTIHEAAMASMALKYLKGKSMKGAPDLKHVYSSDEDGGDFKPPVATESDLYNPPSNDTTTEKKVGKVIVEDDEKKPQQRRRPTVSFKDHAPPGDSDSSNKQSSEELESSSCSTSEDDEQYQKQKAKQDETTRYKKMKKESRKDGEKQGSGSSSCAEEESTIEKELRESQLGKNGKTGNSSKSESEESWEGMHDEYRKRKGGKNFRYKDRHRRRSLHKRKIKFEQILLKDAYRRPSFGTQKPSKRAKPKTDQEILDDKAFEDIEANKARKSENALFGNLGGGGKSLLKAALTANAPRGLNSLEAQPSVVGFDRGGEGLSKARSLWNLSMDEVLLKLKSKNSEASSMGSSASKVNLAAKFGNLQRGLHRTPSQDSTGSAATIGQSSVRKRRQSTKIKIKRTKVTTLSFSLSGDKPTSENSQKEIQKPDKPKMEKRKSMALSFFKPRRARIILPPVIKKHVNPREYTMKKDYTFRNDDTNKRMVLAFQSEVSASQPFRQFLIASDNKELVDYLKFWVDVEKSREDYPFGNMSYSSFVQSLQDIVTKYLIPNAQHHIEAPAMLKQEVIEYCISNELHEMPWQLRKIQKEIFEDLRLAYDAFCQSEIQSFLTAVTLKKCDTGFEQVVSKLPPINNNNETIIEEAEDAELKEEMVMRMNRSMKLVMELCLPCGRILGAKGDASSDESDDDGKLPEKEVPKVIIKPPVDMKELAKLSAVQYPDFSIPLPSLTLRSFRASSRNVQTDNMYKPIKRGGHVLKRPMTRPRNFMEILRDTTHFEFFKRFLKAYRADIPLHFWHAVEGLRQADIVKERHVKARHIIKKYFHHSKTPASKMLMCSADIIKEIPYLDVVTTSMLFSAQTFVCRMLEDRWFRRYCDTFAASSTLSSVATPHEDEETEHSNRAQLLRRGRLKRAWMVFNDFIRRSARFINAMKNPKMQKLFYEFLKMQMYVVDNAQARQSSTKSDILSRHSPPMIFMRNEDVNSHNLKQRMINGQLITFNYLSNDLIFWQNIECYKLMSDCYTGMVSMGCATHKDEAMLRNKATLITSCYLESSIAPAIRVNIPQEIAEITSESLENGLLDRNLFHEATIYVFPLLVHFWKKFCEDHYVYIPTLSKKFKRIYGYKMTPIIEEEIKKERLGLKTMKQMIEEDKKKKVRGVIKPRKQTAEYPNYLEMDESKYTNRRGSPFGLDDMGQRLTFSIAKGITIIEPVRKRKFTTKVGGSPDVRVILDSSQLNNSPKQTWRKKRSPSPDPIVPNRNNRRTGLLDPASLLKHFSL